MNSKKPLGCRIVVVVEKDYDGSSIWTTVMWTDKNTSWVVVVMARMMMMMVQEV